MQHTCCSEDLQFGIVFMPDAEPFDAEIARVNFCRWTSTAGPLSARRALVDKQACLHRASLPIRERPLRSKDSTSNASLVHEEN